MNGAKLTFGEEGPMFDFSTFVTGFDSTMQNALVNAGTNAQSDPVYPDRGTFLVKDGASGQMATAVMANHSVNFAAIRTLQFCQQSDSKSDPNRLRNFRLQIEKFVDGLIQIRAQGVSEGGELSGLLLNI